jgi:hypothetical protein
MTDAIIFILAAGGSVLGFLIAVVICSSIMKHKMRG